MKDVVNTERSTATKPLLIGFAVALALVGGVANAAEVAVTSCADDGTAGTLRAIVMGLSEVDNNTTVDVSACAKITLELGEIAVPVNVTIQGAPNKTTIDANHLSRAFHSISTKAGFDSLTLANLTVTGGFVPTSGGCVLGGSVSLQNSVVTACSAQAFGGGIAANTFDCNASTIDTNQVSGNPGSGGGVSIGGSVHVESCTIEQNVANHSGGLFAGGLDSDDVLIVDSTISSNVAIIADAGVYSSSPLTIRNSTIAFNVAPECAGVHGARSVSIDSSIIAENASTNAGCVDLVSAAAITGNHNLVSVDNGGLPSDTIIADPILTPLANRGGMTRTHGLSINSPAIDAGSNVGGLGFDQRGLGFDRTQGAAVDIGAYERQTDDEQLFFGGEVVITPAHGADGN